MSGCLRKLGSSRAPAISATSIPIVISLSRARRHRNHSRLIVHLYIWASQWARARARCLPCIYTRARLALAGNIVLLWPLQCVVPSARRWPDRRPVRRARPPPCLGARRRRRRRTAQHSGHNVPSARAFLIMKTTINQQGLEREYYAGLREPADASAPNILCIISPHYPAEGRGCLRGKTRELRGIARARAEHADLGQLLRCREDSMVGQVTWFGVFKGITDKHFAVGKFVCEL